MFLDWDRFFRILRFGSVFQNFWIGIDFSEFRDWDRFFRILGLGSIFQNFWIGIGFQNFGIGIDFQNCEIGIDRFDDKLNFKYSPETRAD